MDACRQGDCFLGERGFIELGGLDDKGNVVEDFVETIERGLVLLTQSCDIARPCAERPCVEVCPIVQIDDPDVYAQVVALKRPMYAAIPALSHDCLVADLDRTMTVSKSVLAQWQRTPGLTSDAEVRTFARALARKRDRFAFPDDFNSYVAPLSRRFTEKHSRDSDEGVALRNLLEIRVQATPNWDAPQIELKFYFVRKQHPVEELQKPWDDWKSGWLSRLTKHHRFIKHDSVVTDYSLMTVAQYMESDQIDLVHLSRQG